MKIFAVSALFLVTSLLAPAADDLVTFEYPNSDVLSVLRAYEDLTARKVVFDESVQGKVSVVTGRVSREKVIELIELTLFANGFSLVDVSDDTVQVVGPAANPRSAGLPTYSSLEKLPTGERVVSYIFKLQSRDPVEVAQLLVAEIAASAFTSVVPDPKSGTLVVSERTSVIRHLAEVVHAVDVPKAGK